MADQAELQAKIAALRGQINQRKQQQQPPAQREGQHVAPPHRPHARWNPYGAGPPPRQPVHRNRQLILGGGQRSDANGTQYVPPTATSPLAAMKRAAPASAIRDADQARPEKVPQPKSRPARELVLEGLRFQVQPDGRKLIRISGAWPTTTSEEAGLRSTDSATSNQETPKKVKVADVDFYRTKHGNLIRAAIAKDTRYRSTAGFDMEQLNSRIHLRSRIRMSQCENFTKHGTHSLHAKSTLARPARIRSGATTAFSSPVRSPRTILTNAAGTCSFGPACRYTHDPTRVAICKDFLHTGSCKAGSNCDLSHDATYHRAPACTHFLRGNCTNSACRYPHVNVSPAASVCRPFATLGFCSKGADCDKRHVFECPDYANHGHCANREKKACPLPHIDRAATLRKAAERQARTGSEDESDLSSDDEGGAFDSDVAEEMDMEDDSHPLSQQQDFIAFS